MVAKAKGKPCAKVILTKEILHDLYVVQEKSVKDIREEYCFGHATILRLLNEYEIPIRKSKQGLSIYFKNHSSVDVEFFRNESSELMYIIGLWMSDGCVFKGNGLKLQMSDRDVIEWVADKIGYKREIKKTETGFKPSYTIVFCNQEIADIFLRYGITERKSLTADFPAISDELLPHFIRGIFDGDGSVSVGKRKDTGASYQTVTIVSGSDTFIYKLDKSIQCATGIKSTKITKDSRGNGIYQYRIGNKNDVLKFGNWLYQGDQYGMKRKKDKFISLGIAL